MWRKLFLIGVPSLVISVPLVVLTTKIDLSFETKTPEEINVGVQKINSELSSMNQIELTSPSPDETITAADDASRAGFNLDQFNEIIRIIEGDESYLTGFKFGTITSISDPELKHSFLLQVSYSIPKTKEFLFTFPKELYVPLEQKLFNSIGEESWNSNSSSKDSSPPEEWGPKNANNVHLSTFIEGFISSNSDYLFSQCSFTYEADIPSLLVKFPNNRQTFEYQMTISEEGSDDKIPRKT